MCTNRTVLRSRAAIACSTITCRQMLAYSASSLCRLCVVWWKECDAAAAETGSARPTQRGFATFYATSRSPEQKVLFTATSATFYARGFAASKTTAWQPSMPGSNNSRNFARIVRITCWEKPMRQGYSGLPNLVPPKCVVPR